MSAFDYQSKLLNDIFSNKVTEQFDPKGVAVYQNNLRANAARALSLTFPITKQIIGDQNFQLATNKYLCAKLKTFGDWADFGLEFDVFLSNQTLMENLPYISELAGLERHIFNSVRAKDEKLDLQSIHLLASEDNEQRRFLLASGACVLQSNYPLLEIKRFFERAEEQSNTNFENVIKAIKHDSQHNSSFCILVYRKGFEVYTEYISDTQYTWYQLLLKGSPLGKALKQMQVTDFDIETWLPQAISKQIVIGVT